MKLPKVYEPAEYEQDIYELWEASGAFSPKARGSDEVYSVVVPPPNANGNLHIGHALTFAIQDIAIRYHRMKGEATLFLPGADHAGFETQVVYERELAKQGKSRFDYSREELYEQIWDFVIRNKDTYQNQFRRLGASVDWDRFTFTLDQKVIDRANKTFQKMWDDKLIYRGERLVNFCTFHGTAFADIEVDYETEMGKMYYIRFPLAPVDDVEDKQNYVLIATTRPETMLGDVAVAIHPEDDRYRHLIGRTAIIPLAEREVPIIADTMVDTEFGTGAVKITSAHDPNDFDVAKAHNLPLVRVITEEGKIGYDAPRDYHGLTVEEARKRVIKELEDQGLLEKVEDHEHRVGHCYKCGTPIQPLVREQWFVDMKPLADKAIKALKANRIRFYPSPKLDQLITYMEGLKDWNISRQISWGIPIPAFQNVDDPEDWIFDTRTDQELLAKDGKTYRRDPDVFDTWFSSGQWPFVTLDYPDGKDFSKFYPLSLMETGYDILASWVSRMIMLGLYITGDVPFETVYLHGLVLDEHGAKMSKSKGNVVNPMEMIDQYGSDALRMGIMTGQTAGNNQPFTMSKLVGARNFCNKLWNIARFVEVSLPDNYKRAGELKPKTIADEWMLTRLQQSADDISNYLDGYRFSEAFDRLYHTVWDDFADWYIESSKSAPNHQLLAYGLEVILKLAHPFAPFVTETIWQTLSFTGNSLLITSSWPVLEKGSAKATSDFEAIRGIVGEIRTINSTLGVKHPKLHYVDSELLSDHHELVAKLANLSEVTESFDMTGIKLISTEEDCRIAVENELAEAYLAKLEDKQSVEALNVKKMEGRLANKSYIDNAPAKLVTETKDQLEQARQRLTQINTQIEAINQD